MKFPTRQHGPCIIYVNVVYIVYTANKGRLYAMAIYTHGYPKRWLGKGNSLLNIAILGIYVSFRERTTFYQNQTHLFGQIIATSHDLAPQKVVEEGK